MREIKFRAWDKRSKKMYESYSVDDNGEWIVNDLYTWALEIGTEQDLIQMEYIGRQDRDNDKICEADFLRVLGQKKPVLVEFTHGMFCIRDGFCLLNFGIAPYDIDTNLKIIGNIYENPELLDPK